MKKRLFLFLLLGSLVGLLLSPTVYSCEFAISPASSEVNQNETIEMTAYRQQIHKKCIVDMNEIKIEVSNCTIQNQTGWVKEGYIWSKKLTISFPNIGEASVKIVYDCEKHPGDIVPFTAKINVIEPAKSPPPPDNPPEPEPPSPPPANPPVNPPENQSPVAPPAQPSEPANQTPPPQKTPAPSQPQQPPKPTPVPSMTQNQLEEKATSESFVQQSQLNQTPDTYTAPEAPANQTTESASKSKKPFYSYFYDLSYYLLFMLLFLSMLLYLFRQFRLRYYINLLSLGILGFYLGGCICPIGMFEKIGFKESITPLGIFSIVLLGLLFLISMFFGRIFCGWICPQGALQEVLYRNQKQKKVHPIWKRIFTVLPLTVLLASILIPFFYKIPVFCKIDPFKIPFQLTGPIPLLLVFILLAGLSIAFYRPFCRAVCPLGFFLGIGAWLGEKLHLRIFSSHLVCTTCSSCSKSCQIDALREKDKGELLIESNHCIECGDCQTTCPIKKKIKQTHRRT